MLDSYVLLLRHVGRDSDATAVEARIRLILSDPILETPSTTWAKRGADQGEFDRDRQACPRKRGTARAHTDPRRSKAL